MSLGTHAYSLGVGELARGGLGLLAGDAVSKAMSAFPVEDQRRTVPSGGPLLTVPMAGGASLIMSAALVSVWKCHVVTWVTMTTHLLETM